MRAAFRYSILALGLLPPFLWVALEELSAANLIDLCANECGSVPANLDLFSLFAYILFTPALLVLSLGTLEERETGLRTAGLGVLLLTFYVWIFAPGLILSVSGDAFLRPVTILLPALLTMAMGYLVTTARTPKLIAFVLLAALIPTVLMIATGYPPPGVGTQYSCSETTIVNASSPYPQYANVCSPYQVPLPGPGFVNAYALWVTALATVTVVADIVFIHSHRTEKPPP
jgi:hypothetical protein